MKPIWFTEFGFPSIDKASNKPNVFFDPKSSDGGIPNYSNGKPDYAIQRKGLRATLEFWQNCEFLENIICWTWDARGLDWHRNKYYTDGNLWQYGHWLDGKIAAEKTVILTENLEFDSLKIKTHRLLIKSSVTKSYEEIKYGPKTTYKISREYVIPTSIKANNCEFNVKSFELEGAALYAGKIDITSEAVNLKSIIINNKQEEIFKGKKNKFTGKRQESTTIREWQELHPTVIISDFAMFKVDNLFKAEAIRMKLKHLEFVASDFEFTGIKLQNSLSKSGKTKGWFFVPSSSHSSMSRHIGVEGVLIVASGKAFMLAANKIWLAATVIGANELYVDSPKIELKSMIGEEYYGMKFSKKGAKFNFICKPGELSIGAGIYSKTFEEEHIKQHSYPSALVGENTLAIRSDKLLQHSSMLAGGKGNIVAKEWVATADRLSEYHSVDYTEASIVVKVALKENISGAVNNIRSFVNSGRQIADGENGFAPVNAAFSGFNTICSAAQIASGDVISFGPSITASVSNYSSSTKHITHAMSSANFNSLEVKGNISGDLNIEAITLNIQGSINLTKPQDELYHESTSDNIGLELGLDFEGNCKPLGIGVDHIAQENDRTYGFGLSYNTSSGIGPIRVVYGEGDDRRDISFKAQSIDKLQKAFSEGILERIEDNITGTINQAASSVKGLFKPTRSEEPGVTTGYDPEGAQRSWYIAAGDEGPEVRNKKKEKEIKAQETKSKKLEQNFYEYLAFKESSNKMDVVNDRGYIGLYQMGEGALIDTEYYKKTLKPALSH